MDKSTTPFGDNEKWQSASKYIFELALASPADIFTHILPLLVISKLVLVYWCGDNLKKGLSMQLQLNVNDVKANILFDFLEVFKKDNIINNYKIIDNQPKTTYDDEVLNDISQIGNILRDAKNGQGTKTSTIVTLQDV